MTTPCTRLWEAEALEDGRLGEADRLSFERHTASCDECSHAIASLVALRESMQTMAGSTLKTTTPLEHQRLRRKIMRSANELLLTPYGDHDHDHDHHHHHRPRRFVFGALALGVAVALIALLTRGPKDGGMVATTDRAAARSTSFENTTPAITESDEPGTTTSSPNEIASATHSTMAHSPRKSAVRAWPSLQAELFDDGVASFKAGNYARSDEQLERFVDGFPNDPRCEDADYLRAVAHHRADDKSGAKVLARAYLLKYPNGLRRIDAERILESAE